MRQRKIKDFNAAWVNLITEFQLFSGKLDAHMRKLGFWTSPIVDRMHVKTSITIRKEQYDYSNDHVILFEDGIILLFKAQKNASGLGPADDKRGWKVLKEWRHFPSFRKEVKGFLKFK